MRAAILPRPAWLLPGALCLLWGCAEGDQNTKHYLVAPATSEFYKYGPAQAFGADFVVHRGDRITMLHRDLGYSQVQLADGTTGYMPTEDLKPAPAPATPPRIRGRDRRVTAGAPRSSNVKPVPGDPLFDVTDIPLPLPQEPEKPAKKP
jgi:hypothetical protein